jgi:hypothetical protein
MIVDATEFAKLLWEDAMADAKSLQAKLTILKGLIDQQTAAIEKSVPVADVQVAEKQVDDLITALSPKAPAGGTTTGGGTVTTPL